MDRTYGLRSTENVQAKSIVFLTSIKTYGPATSAKVSRWIRRVLSKAGIDASFFKAYSVRGAATSTAAEACVSITKILEAADWPSQSTFERFYFRPNRSLSFGTTVLKSASNLAELIYEARIRRNIINNWLGLHSRLQPIIII